MLHMRHVSLEHLVILFTLCSVFPTHAQDPHVFALGVVGPMTAVTQDYIAAAVAFDLDFRKNFEPLVRERFGAPIVNITNLHPSLRLQLHIGTDHANSAIGMRTALDWFLGSRNFTPVAGVVGSYYSSVSTPISSNAAVFKVPMVSWASTSPVLSDKNLHPFFLRTVPPDTLQGSAQWGYMQHFGIPSLTYVYTKESFGEGLFQAMNSLAAAAGQIESIHALGVAYQPGAYDLQVGYAACKGIRASGSRFMVLAMGRREINSLMYVMELEDMLYGNYQILSTENNPYLPDNEYSPSHGFPLGFQKFEPVSVGRLFPKLQELWSRLTPADMYSASALEEYSLNKMLVPLEDSSVPPLSLADLQDTNGFEFFVPFLFDAAYAFVVAINNLLNAGVSPSDIQGTTLLEELQRCSFEGTTGHVSFNEDGDRSAAYDLWNLQNSDGSQVPVGRYSIGTNALSLSSDPMWAGGNRSAMPPATLFECPFGFEQDVATGACEPCRTGIGCGYQEEDGFPLGILGPMTSLSHEFVAAAVAFDLDFRKNFEPELRQRLGAPIINISDLHPSLRLKLQIGTSHSEPKVGLNTAVDWLLGQGGFSRVAGIVGGYYSSVSLPISANAAVFEVPMVSWASTAPELSNKQQHPYFLRTVAPDTVQGSAMWIWMRHFLVPAVAFFYTREAYGTGLFEVVQDLAGAVEQSSRVSGVSIEHSAHSFDVSLAQAACNLIRELGTKFIILAMPMLAGNAAMYVMETEGMLYTGFQILASEDIHLLTASSGLRPSLGLPVGFQKFAPVSRGELFPELLNLWSQLSPDDIYSAEASQRYMLDGMKEPLDALVAPLRDEDFLNVTGLEAGSTFLFDAAYSFVFAINSLLNAGVKPTEIFGDVLLQAVKEVQFQGVSGAISFDANGDRTIDYEFWNWQPSTTQHGAAVAAAAAGNSSDASAQEQTSAVLAAYFRVGSDSFEMIGSDRIYWADGVYSSTVPTELLACSAGFQWDALAGVCTACPPGWVSAGGVAAQCSACPPGSTSSSAVTCEECPEGTFSAYGGANCSSCALGTFSALPGQSACEDCHVGSFGPQEGLAACLVCAANLSSADLWTTMSSVMVNGATEYAYTTAATMASACGCNIGARHDATGECIPCTEGMICKGMSDVRIAAGFAADADLSVYRCYGDSKRCVGGLPGNTCAFGRKGRACSECKDGMAPGSNGPCEDCKDGDIGLLICVLVFLVGCLIGTYHFVDNQNRMTQSHALLLCAVALGQFITMTQTFGVLLNMALEFEQPLQDVINALGLVSFNLELLRLSCIGATEPVVRYTIKIAIIFAAVLATIVVHAVYVAIRHSGQFKARLPSLIGCIGTLFMVFYISATAAVLEPVQCQEHPNSEWSMRSHPGVICWDSPEHSSMLVIGSFTFLAIPVAFFVGCCVVIFQYPARVRAADAAFLKAFSFLFFRFTPEKRHFAIVHFARSFLVALTLVLPDVSSQVFILELIFFTVTLAALYHWPWRGDWANCLDCFCNGALLFVVCVGSLFIQDEDRHPSRTAWVATTVIVASLAILFLAVVIGLYRQFGRTKKPFQFFLCHHKASAGAFARLVKMHLLDSGKLQSDVFIDSDNLNNLDNLFNHVGHDTQNLVVIASSLILTRPWCVGEICTARAQQVRVVVISMPDFTTPDKVFIDEVEVRISNVSILIESGMSIPLLQSTLQWFASIAPIKLAGSLSIRVVDVLVTSLVARDEKEPAQDEIVGVHRADTTGKANVILYDPANYDAAASALVLQKLLTVKMSEKPNLIPALWSSGALPHACHQCLVLCTAACFDRADVLKLLVQLWDHLTSLSSIPILADAAFVIPPSDTVKGWAVQAPLGFAAEEGLHLAQVVHKLFKEIAVTFQPNMAAESILNVGASDLSRRLQGLMTSSSSRTKSINQPWSGEIFVQFSDARPSDDQIPVQNAEQNELEKSRDFVAFDQGAPPGEDAESAAVQTKAHQPEDVSDADFEDAECFEF